MVASRKRTRRTRALGGSMFAKPFGNAWLNAAMAWKLVLLVCVVYVPALQAAFATFAVGWSDWFMVFAVSFSIVPVLELVKFVQRRSEGGLS